MAALLQTEVRQSCEYNFDDRDIRNVWTRKLRHSCESNPNTYLDKSREKTDIRQQAGVLGFSRTLAIEGAKYNIHVNTIAPTPLTALGSSFMPAEAKQLSKPDYLIPLVLALCSDKAPSPTGKLYEAGGGRFSRTRWQRSGGYSFPSDAEFSPEAVLEKWNLITSFDSRADHPEGPDEGSKRIMANIQKHGMKVSFSISTMLTGTQNPWMLTFSVDVKHSEGCGS